MYALTDDLGLRLEIDPLITRRDDGDAAPLQLTPSREGITRLLEVQRARMAAAAGGGDAGVAPQVEPGMPDPPQQKHCGAGSSTVTVDPFGNVYPCVQWRRRIGNLHHHSITALWRDSRVLDDVRRVVVDVRRSADANLTPGISFCPGTAEQETGNPAGMYPAVRVMLDLRKKIPA